MAPPALNACAAANVPSPLPSMMSIIELDVVDTAMSRSPSLLKSPSATADGSSLALYETASSNPPSPSASSTTARFWEYLVTVTMSR